MHAALVCVISAVSTNWTNHFHYYWILKATGLLKMKLHVEGWMMKVHWNIYCYTICFCFLFLLYIVQNLRCIFTGFCAFLSIQSSCRFEWFASSFLLTFSAVKIILHLLYISFVLFTTYFLYVCVLFKWSGTIFLYTD